MSVTETVSPTTCVLCCLETGRLIKEKIMDRNGFKRPKARHSPNRPTFDRSTFDRADSFLLWWNFRALGIIGLDDDSSSRPKTQTSVLIPKLFKLPGNRTGYQKPKPSQLHVKGQTLAMLHWWASTIVRY